MTNLLAMLANPPCYGHVPGFKGRKIVGNFIGLRKEKFCPVQPAAYLWIWCANRMARILQKWRVSRAQAKVGSWCTICLVFVVDTLKGRLPRKSESPRDSRRLFGLSQATTSVF